MPKFKTRVEYAEDKIRDRVLAMGYCLEVAEIVAGWAYSECGANPVDAELSWRSREKVQELAQLRHWNMEDRLRRVAAGYLEVVHA